MEPKELAPYQKLMDKLKNNEGIFNELEEDEILEDTYRAAKELNNFLDGLRAKYSTICKVVQNDITPISNAFNSAWYFAMLNSSSLKVDHNNDEILQLLSQCGELSMQQKKNYIKDVTTNMIDSLDRVIKEFSELEHNLCDLDVIKSRIDQLPRISNQGLKSNSVTRISAKNVGRNQIKYLISQFMSILRKQRSCCLNLSVLIEIERDHSYQSYLLYDQYCKEINTLLALKYRRNVCFGVPIMEVLFSKNVSIIPLLDQFIAFILSVDDFVIKISKKEVTPLQTQILRLAYENNVKLTKFYYCDVSVVYATLLEYLESLPSPLMSLENYQSEIFEPSSYINSSKKKRENLNDLFKDIIQSLEPKIVDNLSYIIKFLQQCQFVSSGHSNEMKKICLDISRRIFFPPGAFINENAVKIVIYNMIENYREFFPKNINLNRIVTIFENEKSSSVNLISTNESSKRDVVEDQCEPLQVVNDLAFQNTL